VAYGSTHPSLLIFLYALLVSSCGTRVLPSFWAVLFVCEPLSDASSPWGQRATYALLYSHAATAGCSAAGCSGVLKRWLGLQADVVTLRRDGFHLNCAILLQHAPVSGCAVLPTLFFERTEKASLPARHFAAPPWSIPGGDLPSAACCTVPLYRHAPCPSNLHFSFCGRHFTLLGDSVLYTLPRSPGCLFLPFHTTSWQAACLLPTHPFAIPYLPRLISAAAGGEDCCERGRAAVAATPASRVKRYDAQATFESDACPRFTASYSGISRYAWPALTSCLLPASPFSALAEPT